MLEVANRTHWWVPGLRGVAAIVFGILAIAWPGLGLVTMVALFGAYALVDGIITLVGLTRHQRSGEIPWWLQLLGGVAGIVAGLMTFFYPGITTVALLSFIAAWAVVVGVANFITAIHQRGMPGAVSLGLSGLASLLFGVLMVLRPEAGAVAVAWIVGIYAILAGAALVAVAAALRTGEVSGPRIMATLFPAEKVGEKARRD